MRKLSHFISGLLAGALIMTATTVFASGGKLLVNAKVGSVWELYVDNNRVGDVPVIKGSSYAPVRQIAEISGFDVTFERGKVFLSTKEGGDINEHKDGELIELQINYYKRMIDSLKISLSERKTELTSLTAEQARKEVEDTISSLEERIAEYEAEIATLEANR